MLRWSVEESRCDDLGLLAAERADPGLWDLIEYASRSQTTLRDAIRCIARLVPLVADAIAIAEEESGDAWAIATAPAAFRLGAPVDFALASIVLAARRHTGRPFLAPREVWVEHGPPADTTHYGRLFQAVVKFGMPRNRIIFDSCDLALPLRRADAYLVTLLDGAAQRMLRESRRYLTTAERVRRLLPGLIASGSASIACVANELGIAPRTLHRRLADEGVTFRRLVSEVRQQLAVAYLEERRHDIAEIAELLGFSGVPAFHRAFKRWTNETPGKYGVAESGRL
jgi:AraC-like DNA-binding protein